MSDQLDKVEILDCTLRDGSYVNQFQFSCEDTVILCSGLDNAGIKRIEVGHGLGVDASSKLHGIALETDSDYVTSAKSAVKNASIGVFFIPGIGDVSSLSPLIDNGLDFVRVGIDVDNIPHAIKALEAALKFGLEVHLNLMKTYAIPIDDVISQLSLLNGMPLRTIYVVDSAGCMLPDQVSEYVTAIRSDNWSVGFHGHDNLGLANANSLAAARAGGGLIDGSLGGMGRSAGNAQTEVLSWILPLQGHSMTVDSMSLLRLVADKVRPLLEKNQGKEVIDVLAGMARFHSGFLAEFENISKRKKVDLFELIREVSKKDCLRPSTRLVNQVASDLAVKLYGEAK